jgi:hypothetical protein
MAHAETRWLKASKATYLTSHIQPGSLLWHLIAREVGAKAAAMACSLGRNMVDILISTLVISQVHENANLRFRLLVSVDLSLYYTLATTCLSTCHLPFLALQTT